MRIVAIIDINERGMCCNVMADKELTYRLGENEPMNPITGDYVQCAKTPEMIHYILDQFLLDSIRRKMNIAGIK